MGSGISIYGPTAPVVGAFITPTFSAGNFTSSSGSWTVAAGDVTTYAYSITGKLMTVLFCIVTSTVTGTPASLRIAVPASKTIAKTFSSMGYGVDNGGNPEAIRIEGTASQAYIQLNKLVGNWAASTDATKVVGQAVFEIV